MCALLVGLPGVVIVGVESWLTGPVRVHVETVDSMVFCAGCGSKAWVKDRRTVELVDVGCFGRPARLVWRKRRWRCPQSWCRVGSWTEDHPHIAAARLAMTDRAGRWVTSQVGRWARSVNEIAVELGCDWHTINDAVIAYGTALVDDDPDRIGDVTALGLDEVLFVRLGKWRRLTWSTQLVDVRRGQLLDVVKGRSAAGPCEWLDKRGPEWCGRIEWATLDLSGPYRKVFDTMLPDATQVADPFHLVKLAQPEARRGTSPGAERDVRSPGPQRRSALPVPPAPHQGR